MDKIEGYLEVGVNLEGEVVINLPRDMTGHIKFSPNQARNLAMLLLKHADIIAPVPKEPWPTLETHPHGLGEARYQWELKYGRHTD